MKEELEKILTNLSDAGRCRCSRMEELHESQRKVDCLDFLIRQTAKTNQ